MDALTGVTWLTGSTGCVWAVCIRCTTPPSVSSMTYLRALAYVWACCPTQAAPAHQFSVHAPRSATVSCWAERLTACGPTTAASTPSLSTHPPWSSPAAAAPPSQGWCRATRLRFLITKSHAKLDTWCTWKGHTIQTAWGSASLRAGGHATQDSLLLHVLAGWRFSSTIIDSTHTHTLSIYLNTYFSLFLSVSLSLSYTHTIPKCNLFRFNIKFYIYILYIGHCTCK